jgi:serine/threonine protein phosphatase PrpC
VTISTKTRPDGSNQISPPTLRLEAAAASNAGQVRETNEDVFGVFLDERLFVVADGMGGRAAGEVAARLAVDALEAFCRENRDTAPEAWPFALDDRFSRSVNLLRVGLKVANRGIREEAKKDPAWYRMGATVAALTFDSDHLVAAHAGDVRIYRVRGGSISRLTRDHSILEEMKSAQPALSPQEIAGLVNRNVITRALGSKPDVEPTVYTNSYSAGDIYLLCSDGLWDTVDDAGLKNILLAQPDVEAAANTLVDAANAAGAPDNVTALVIRVSR